MYIASLKVFLSVLYTRQINVDNFTHTFTPKDNISHVANKLMAYKMYFIYESVGNPYSKRDNKLVAGQVLQNNKKSISR